MRRPHAWSVEWDRLHRADGQCCRDDPGHAREAEARWREAQIEVLRAQSKRDVDGSHGPVRSNSEGTPGDTPQEGS